jgi:hypothetical protein
VVTKTSPTSRELLRQGKRPTGDDEVLLSMPPIAVHFTVSRNHAHTEPGRAAALDHFHSSIKHREPRTSPGAAEERRT